MPCPYEDWVCFAHFGRGPGGNPRCVLELGSFRMFWLLAVCFWQLAGWNWVRFVYLDRGPGWGRGKLGSFCAVGQAAAQGWCGNR